MLDQEKIGKFIAERRKNHSMTQRQLAEKLGISDKAVSKWETGRSMPDNALLIELCDILDMNVNELLSGEKLSDDSYHGKAEENMVNLIQQTENEKKMRKRTWSGMMMGSVLLVLSLGYIMQVSAGNIFWYLDLTSLIMLLAITIIVLVSSGLGKDFLRAFSISSGKQKDVNWLRVGRSLTACRLVLIVVPVTGGIATLAAIISMFGQGVAPEMLGKNVAVSMLTILYSLVIDLFLLPVTGRLAVLKKQLENGRNGG